MLVKYALNNSDKTGQCHCKKCGVKICEGEECKECMKLDKHASIDIKPSHEGLLHQELNVPKGEPIPTGVLESKLKSTTDPAEKKRLVFALNARKWHHAS